MQRFVIIPLFLFGGAFYPITQLPGWTAGDHQGAPAVARRRAGRSFTLGDFDGTATVVHVVVPLCWIVGGIVLAHSVLPQAAVRMTHARAADLPADAARRAPAAADGRAQRRGLPTAVADHRSAGSSSRCSTCCRSRVGLGELIGDGRRSAARARAVRPVRRPGADGRVGDERRGLRLDDERLPQAEVGTHLRRRAGDADVGAATSRSARSPGR